MRGIWGILRGTLTSSWHSLPKKCAAYLVPCLLSVSQCADLSLQGFLFSVFRFLSMGNRHATRGFTRTMLSFIVQHSSSVPGSLRCMSLKYSDHLLLGIDGGGIRASRLGKDKIFLILPNLLGPALCQNEGTRAEGIPHVWKNERKS